MTDRDRAQSGKGSIELAFEMVRLNDEAQHADAVTQWIYDEWHEHSGDDLETIRGRLMGGADCPPALIAVRRGEAIGVVAFKRYPLPKNNAAKEAPDEVAKPWELWVDVLYVHENWRRRGIGERLLDGAVETVRSCIDERQLFVYTEIADYYQQFGWTGVPCELEGGHAVLSLDL